MSKSMISLEEGWDAEIKPKAIDVLLDILEKGFDKVRVSPFPPNSFMPIYTTCYNMCTQRAPFNFSQQLYERHGQTFDRYLDEQVLPSLEKAHDEVFLAELVKRWMNHKLMNKWMSRFFMYLDRYYVKHHNLPTLEDAGLQSFDRVVFQKIKHRLKWAVLELIEKERNGEIIDTTLVRSCIEIYEIMGMKSLDVYQADFENQLLLQSRQYYSAKSKAWLSEDSTPVYLQKVEEALQSERSRVERYLNKITDPKLQKVLEDVLLQVTEKELIERENSGVIALLRNDKLDDLARMYRLFSRIKNGLDPIADLVQKHITAVGNDIVEKRANAVAEGNIKDAASDPEYIKSILAIHDKFRSVVNEQFQGNSLFQKALKEAFVEFVNKDVGPDSSAKLMSTFCDRILKTGGEKLSDEQVEDYLEKVVFVFSYLTRRSLHSGTCAHVGRSYRSVGRSQRPRNPNPLLYSTYVRAPPYSSTYTASHPRYPKMTPSLDDTMNVVDVKALASNDTKSPPIESPVVQDNQSEETLADVRTTAEQQTENTKKSVTFDAADVIEFEPTAWTATVSSDGVPVGLSNSVRRRTRRRLDSYEGERLLHRVDRQEYMEHGYLEPDERLDILEAAGHSVAILTHVERDTIRINRERWESNEYDLLYQFGLGETVIMDLDEEDELLLSQGAIPGYHCPQDNQVDDDEDDEMLEAEDEEGNPAEYYYYGNRCSTTSTTSTTTSEADVRFAMEEMDSYDTRKYEEWAWDYSTDCILGDDSDQFSKDTFDLPSLDFGLPEMSSSPTDVSSPAAECMVVSYGKVIGSGSPSSPAKSSSSLFI